MANTTVYPFGTNGTLPAGVGIINDLKTGGADKALSAEQGKILGGMVIEYIPIKLSEYGKSGGLIAAGGAWTGSNTHKFTQFKVKPGEVYSITAGTNYASYAFFASLGVWSNGGTPPYATGETGRHDILAGETAEFSIPEGCSYLYIALYNSTSPATDLTPQSVMLRREVLQAVSDGDSANEQEISALRGNFHELWSYEDAEVVSNNSEKISIVKSNGEIVITNITKTQSCYALVKLPSGLVPGKAYKLTIDYTAGFNLSDTENWWWGLAKSNYDTTSGGVALYPGERRKVTTNITIGNNDVYLRLASNSQNSGATVVFHSISFSDNLTDVASLTERVASLEEDAGAGEMENRIRQAKYVAESPSATALALLHFTDIHGDTAAALQIKAFATKYASYIDDLVQTGDTVYYYYNSSGQGYEWYQQNGIPEALFVLGNHDGSADDNSQGWKEGSADWDFKGKAWDFDTYFADYITERGVTPPSGYDDSSSPYYKACYWHKDYASAKIRVIGLDCMHFNDGVRYTSNDQETWLAAKLQETLTSGNAAYGYSVVFLCHYPLDDYSGNNETWDDSNHRFTFNKNAGGGHVMDANTQRPVNCHYGTSFTAEARFSMRNRVGTVGSPSYTKGTDNPIGDVIKSWMDNGGKYIAWLSGHTHTEYMYYPAKYPNMLVIGLPQAGNTRGDAAADRANDSAMHSCANLIVFDTQHTLIKIIRFGKTLDRRLMKFETLCYNYGSSDRSVGR